MHTANDTTSSDAPSTTGHSASSSQSNDPSLALSEGLLKLNWLNGLADLRRAQQSNHELLAAHLEQQYGKKVMSSGEDVIAVESPITHTTNNYHAAPTSAESATSRPTWPAWLRAGVLVLGSLATGGLATLLAQSALRPSSAATQNAPPTSQGSAGSPGFSRAYELDFWDPTEVTIRD